MRIDIEEKGGTLVLTRKNFEKKLKLNKKENDLLEELVGKIVTREQEKNRKKYERIVKQQEENKKLHPTSIPEDPPWLKPGFDFGQ